MMIVVSYLNKKGRQRAALYEIYLLALTKTSTPLRQ